MGKSKVHMPKELEKKCHAAIHSAATAAAAAGAIPIPMSDAIPITAAQIGMIVAIGKIFGVKLTDAAAKSIMGVTVTQHAGRAVVSNVLKAFPGAGTIVGGVIGASTAVVLTETLGWMVADDFFRMSNEEEPVNLVDAAGIINGNGVFRGLKWSK